MTPILRDCTACPARTDCMASVLRRGPLLRGCDGRRAGWQNRPADRPKREDQQKATEENER